MTEARISVVMPMREVDPAPMLDSLLGQNIPMQIIAVDDCSEDDTAEKVAGWASRTGQPVEILRNRKRLYSYGSRLAGLERANAPVVWNVDADDVIPPNADIGNALKQMEKDYPDILHCRAAGVEKGCLLQKALLWSEPFALSLSGKDIFHRFMEQDYPPAILWNKFFSLNLCKKICQLAPDVEVRYFDVKFIGLISLLLAQTYRASNDLVYQYSMRAIRPASLYAKQVKSLILLEEKLGPLVDSLNHDGLHLFRRYCLERLVIQTGHLSIMAAHELTKSAEMDHVEWLESQILDNIDLQDLLNALVLSCKYNTNRIKCILDILKSAYPTQFSVNVLGKTRNAQSDGPCSKLAPKAETDIDFESVAKMPLTPRLVLRLLMLNASYARSIISVLAPHIDITKKAN